MKSKNPARFWSQNRAGSARHTRETGVGLGVSLDPLKVEVESPQDIPCTQGMAERRPEKKTFGSDRMRKSAESVATAARTNWPALRRARRPGEPLTVWQARPRIEQSFIAWGDVCAAWTHWTGFRTVGCPGRHHDCPWCRVQTPRPKWYAGAYALGSGLAPEEHQGRCAVELTLAARRGCSSWGLPLAARHGRRFTVGRVDHRRAAQVWCRFDPGLYSPLPTARRVDPRNVLRRLWTSGPDALTLHQVEELLVRAEPLNVEVDLLGGRP
jgi:hypothetical protein